MGQVQRFTWAAFALALLPVLAGPGFSATRDATPMEAAPAGPVTLLMAEAAMPATRPRARTADLQATAPAPGNPSLVTGGDARPRSRPASVAAAVPEVTAGPSTPLHLYSALRPAARPEGLAAVAPRRAAPQMAIAAPAAPARPSRNAGVHNPNETSGHYNATPAAVVRPAPGVGAGVTGTTRGSVCGVPGLMGETVSPVAGRVRGCGIDAPVKITSVSGVRLSQAAVMDCDTARALNTWVQRGLKPAFGATGGGVTGLQVAGHYVCRTRNHRAGARISEHGRGRAIDISGIILANGNKLSILRDWRGRNGAPIKAAHRAACGIFGTTLGPGSDGMHEDHLHFDTAKHRSGAYCR